GAAGSGRGLSSQQGGGPQVHRRRVHTLNIQGDPVAVLGERQRRGSGVPAVEARGVPGAGLVCGERHAVSPLSASANQQRGHGEGVRIGPGLLRRTRTTDGRTQPELRTRRRPVLQQHTVPPLDRADWLRLSSSRILLPAGPRHHGGRSGNSHDPPGSGRSLRLRPEEGGGLGGGVGLRANQLTEAFFKDC
ncbi:hypothetical protein PFLUV_G00161750, partial [Perca fluviatilis]